MIEYLTWLCETMPYCTECGFEAAEHDRFCYECGYQLGDESSVEDQSKEYTRDEFGILSSVSSSSTSGTSGEEQSEPESPASEPLSDPDNRDEFGIILATGILGFTIAIVMAVAFSYVTSGFLVAVVTLSGSGYLMYTRDSPAKAAEYGFYMLAGAMAIYPIVYYSTSPFASAVALILAGLAGIFIAVVFLVIGYLFRRKAR